MCALAVTGVPGGWLNHPDGIQQEPAAENMKMHAFIPLERQEHLQSLPVVLIVLIVQIIPGSASSSFNSLFLYPSSLNPFHWSPES